MDDALVPTSMGKTTRMALYAVIACVMIFILITTILTFTFGADNAAWVVVGVSLVGLMVMLGFLMKWTRDGTSEPEHIRYLTLGLTLTMIILCSSLLAVLYQPAPTPTYTIGGAAANVVGSGLMLQNGKDTVAISAGTARGFTFPKAVAKGGRYQVTIKTQPSSSSCSVIGGSGTASKDINTVQVTCTPAWRIGGTVEGLSASGLVITNNGHDDLPVTSGARDFQFVTAVADGGKYDVEIKTQPTGQTCAVTFNQGTATKDVTDVAITCRTL